MIVVDACAWVHALVGDASSERVRATLRADPRWVAPAHMPIEVLRAIKRGVDGGQLSPDQADAAVAAVATTHLQLLPATPRMVTAVWSLRANVGLYDAPYVVAARELGIPLVTLDRRLARAAESLGADVLVPA